MNSKACSTAAFVLTAALAIGAELTFGEDAKSPREAKFDGKSGHLHGFSLLILLNDKHVQDELDMSDKHRQAAASDAAEFLAWMKREFNKALSADEDPTKRAAAMADYADERQKQLEDHGSKLAQRLNDEQRDRLAEIAFQLRGFEVFFTPDVVDSLRLNEAQQEQLLQVRQWIVDEVKLLSERRAANDLNAAAYRREVKLLLRMGQQFALDTLQARQRRVFDDLSGKPIVFEPEQVQMTIAEKPAKKNLDQRPMKSGSGKR